MQWHFCHLLPVRAVVWHFCPFAGLSHCHPGFVTTLLPFLQVSYFLPGFVFLFLQVVRPVSTKVRGCSFAITCWIPCVSWLRVRLFCYRRAPCEVNFQGIIVDWLVRFFYVLYFISFFNNVLYVSQDSFAFDKACVSCFNKLFSAAVFGSVFPGILYSSLK
jgi:hypothetical protein